MNFAQKTAGEAQEGRETRGGGTGGHQDSKRSIRKAEDRHKMKHHENKKINVMKLDQDTHEASETCSRVTTSDIKTI